MRKLAALIAILIFVLPACASPRPGQDLYLSITLTKEERSKDSHAKTTTLTISGDQLSYDVISRGFRAGAPVQKKFRVTAKDIERIKNLIKARNLLVSDSFQYKNGEAGAMRRTFKIAIDIRMDGKKSLIELSGPSNKSEIKEQKSYQNANALVQEIFKIIQSQDDEIVYVELVN